MKEKLPKVGVGLLIWKNGKILLQRRKGAHGGGEYCGTGGHLEFGESIIDCARRETREEAGIEIKNIKFLTLINLKGYSGKHYVDIGLTAEWKSGTPKIMETNKCSGWDWYDPKKLPEPLFKSVPYYLEALKKNKNFFDF